MKERIEKVKTHLSENKTTYILTASGIVLGSLGTLLVSPKGVRQLSIANPALFNYKPVATTVQVAMTRPGPKSFVVQCLETQQTWPSIRQAAKDLGLNPGELSKHIAGKVGSVAGMTFEKVAEL